MPTRVSPTRPSVDRCPSLRRPYSSPDGALIRLRVPGGRISVTRLAALREIAERHGAGFVHLTSRANLQLRALPDPLPREVVDAVLATGLAPSFTHERARNILAAPLATELSRLVAELDAGLCADPALADLPGRFLFALSDASGSVLSEPWDLAYQRLDHEHGLLCAAGYGAPVHPDHAVRALLDRARAFLRTRPTPRIWNVRELPPHSAVFAGLASVAPAAAPPLLPGVYPRAGVTGPADVVAALPRGELRQPHLDALAAGAPAGEVILTPWRSLVIPGGAQSMRALASAGFIVHSPRPAVGPAHPNLGPAPPNMGPTHPNAVRADRRPHL